MKRSRRRRSSPSLLHAALTPNPRRAPTPSRQSLSRLRQQAAARLVSRGRVQQHHAAKELRAIGHEDQALLVRLSLRHEIGARRPPARAQEAGGRDSRRTRVPEYRVPLALREARHGERSDERRGRLVLAVLARVVGLVPGGDDQPRGQKLAGGVVVAVHAVAVVHGCGEAVLEPLLPRQGAPAAGAVLGEGGEVRDQSRVGVEVVVQELGRPARHADVPN
mmetsp:Transcript_17974/g.57278  ORF Transcript_17974/g.57278 Transcript_17974/m.57278 type:complete len:221 (-) Transcript_17974:142-804(-)